MLEDGIEALRREFRLHEIMRLIERTAKWVDPQTFRLLPVWFPEHSRKGILYKSNWSVVRKTKDDADKREGNAQANKALTWALGLRSKKRPSWSCCHIWGVEDPRYQRNNTVVQDPRDFSCIANMVLLPTPLKAFTDTMPDVKAMLRICAKHLYNWQCDHEDVAEEVAKLRRWRTWDAYPSSWPRRRGDAAPPGVMALNDDIRRKARKRMQQIKRDLEAAGKYYPREQVQHVLAYWRINL